MRVSVFGRHLKGACVCALSLSLSVVLALSCGDVALATPSFYKDDYPSSYYLTNLGQVTSVKLQSPWQSCWAFAIASALESSILKATAAATDETPEADAGSTPRLTDLSETVDVSERALAWFAHETQTDESGQPGEGYYRVNPSDATTQLGEGNFEMVISQLIARQNIVSESAAPYQYNDYDGNPAWYGTGTRLDHHRDARMRDWSLDPSIRTTNDIGWNVDEVYKLPSPAVTELNAEYGDYDYVGYYAPATRAIKSALMDVGGVAVAIEADAYLPSAVQAGNAVGQAPSEHFTYSTWSQYNGADYMFCNHAVTIVGWDDNYSANNFAGSTSGRPSGNGAWLCKNNWGSDALYAGMGATADATHWGLPDANGNATGFFWLSYYDHSISSPIAFGVQPINDESETVYQYDYLGAAEYTKPNSYSTDAWVANAFTAQSTELLEATSAQTFDEGQTVDVAIYRISPDVDLTTVSAEELFEHAQLVTEKSETFEQAGLYRIELDKPVIFTKGEHFIVAERLSGKAKTSTGVSYDATFLSVEMAYTANIEGSPQSTMATVVSNPGETFLGFDGTWMSVADYNQMYADSRAESQQPVDVVFGNALAKAYTSNTTIAESNQIYELRVLEQPETDD